MALSHRMFAREREDHRYTIVSEEISESEPLSFFAVFPTPRQSLAWPMGILWGLDWPEPIGFVRPEPGRAGPAYRLYRLCTSCLIGRPT